jgi:acetyl-CoA C-acetyltransferase
MRRVSVLGVGQTPVANHADSSITKLAVHAGREALEDAAVDDIDAIVVGNMMAGEITGQSHLGPLVAVALGFRGIESVTVNAACASGGAAVRNAYLAVASGTYDTVLVVGVEKMSGVSRDAVVRSLATAADAACEAACGATFVALNALLMRRYMYEFNAMRLDFATFAEVAHQHAMSNPNARFRGGLERADYLASKIVADPVGVYDASPIADGAAAVVLSAKGRGKSKTPAVDIIGSASATDSLSLQERDDILHLSAVEKSARSAFSQAGRGPEDVDLFEPHDAFTIMTALSLEACGFTPPGTSTDFAREAGVHRHGMLPICTFGGLKARGHPVGASGAYQIVEATLQLRGEAGPNQVPSARCAMTQSIGGSGATVVTHLLERST